MTQSSPGPSGAGPRRGRGGKGVPRSRYGRYAGGPDPLAPPVDVAEALDAVAAEVSSAAHRPQRGDT